MEENFLFYSRNCEEGTYKFDSESGCIPCEDLEWGFLTKMADFLNVSYKHDEDKQSFCQRISEEAQKQLLYVKPKKQKTSNELDIYYDTIINSNNFDEISELFDQVTEIEGPADEEGFVNISFIRTLYQLDKQQIAHVINLFYHSAPLDRINVPSFIFKIENALMLKKIDLRLIQNEVLFAVFQHHQLGQNLIKKIIDQDYVDILNEFLYIKQTKIEKQGLKTLLWLNTLLRSNETLFKLVVERIPYYGDINFRRQVLYNLNYLLKLPYRGDVFDYLKVAREKLILLLTDYDNIMELKKKLNLKQ